MSEFDPSSVAFFILLVSPLILNAIDKIYYKIRPFKTPLSAINRNDKNRMDAFDRPKEKMSKYAVNQAKNNEVLDLVMCFDGLTAQIK